MKRIYVSAIIALVAAPRFFPAEVEPVKTALARVRAAIVTPPVAERKAIALPETGQVAWPELFGADVAELVGDSRAAQIDGSCDRARERDCVLALIRIRTAARLAQRGEVALENETNPQALSDRFYEELLAGDSPNYAKAGEVVARLLEVEPENPAVTSVGMRLGLKLENEELLARALERAEALDPADPTAIAVRLANEKRRGDKEGLRDLAAHLDEEMTESPLPKYFLAWEAYESGDLDSSRALLEAAAHVAPEDERIAQALKAVESAEGNSAPIFRELLTDLGPVPFSSNTLPSAP